MFHLQLMLRLTTVGCDLCDWLDYGVGYVMLGEARRGGLGSDEKGETSNARPELVRCTIASDRSSGSGLSEGVPSRGDG